MQKFLMKYNNAIARYRSGEFGNETLSLYQILSRAGDPNLLDKMCLSELYTLHNSSYGISKHMFDLLISQKRAALLKLDALEKELQSFHIQSHCTGDDLSAAELARDLRLVVRYCFSHEMPEDVEATLSPTDDENYVGEIKVLGPSEKFSFMHEIIHYFRDVGVGNRVQETYTRKKQGKTDSPEEQDINYLTAAAIMPFEVLACDLDKYEQSDAGGDSRFIIQVAQKYSQKQDAVLRRFVEVRKLVDYYNLVATGKIFN